MFARHYLRNLGWFLFLELLRCFSSLGLPPSPYIFRSGYPCGWVSPFRYVRIKAYLPAPRTFSQAITSFIACNRQGIHHMHLFAWSYNVKTWTLFKFRSHGAWDTRHSLLKQLFSICKVVQIEMVYLTSLVLLKLISLRTFILETKQKQNVSILQSFNIISNIAHFEHTTSSQSYVLTLLLPFC